MWKRYEGPLQFFDGEGNVIEDECCSVCDRDLRDWKTYQLKSGQLICQNCVDNPVETVETLLFKIEQLREQV